MIAKENIFPTITSTKGSDWKAKIEEAGQIGLQKVALFLTCLKTSQRQELYNDLSRVKIKEIPFVHLRHDMTFEEVDFLIKKYNTRVFNIHAKQEIALNSDLLKYKDKIYIENIFTLFDDNQVKGFGGICLDLAHLENDRINEKERYNFFINKLNHYHIGCNHVGAIRNKCRAEKKEKDIFYRNDWHMLDDFSELDYLKNYPDKYFSSFIALEFENDLKTQLEARDYIFNLLGKK